MFDIPLRPLKDFLASPLLSLVPSTVQPTHITLLAFLAGLGACSYAAAGDAAASTSLFLLNRLLDCMDGGLARARGTSSEVGGFMDLLCDFVVYSLIPLSIASSLGQPENCIETWGRGSWSSIAVLEASFYLNNFVLFYAAAITEKASVRSTKDGRGEHEVTSLNMRPALVEGFESGVFFTAMLAFPSYLFVLAWGMSMCVFIGTVQRIGWLVGVLSREDAQKVKRDTKDKLR